MTKYLIALVAVAAMAGCSATSTTPAAAPSMLAAGTNGIPTAVTPIAPAPSTPADGGMAGSWSASYASKTITVTFDATGSSLAAKAADACRVLAKGAPVIWLVTKVANDSGAIANFGGATIVTGDGQQVNSTNGVETLNRYYGDADSLPAAEAPCSAANQVIAAHQLAGGVEPGATVVGLSSIPTAVASVKSVTVNGIALTYRP